MDLKQSFKALKASQDKIKPNGYWKIYGDTIKGWIALLEGYFSAKCRIFWRGKFLKMKWDGAWVVGDGKICIRFQVELELWAGDTA